MAALIGERLVFCKNKERIKEEGRGVAHGCISRRQLEYQQLVTLWWPFYYRFICADSVLAFCHSRSFTCKFVTFRFEFIGF